MREHRAERDERTFVAIPRGGRASVSSKKEEERERECSAEERIQKTTELSADQYPVPACVYALAKFPRPIHRSDIP